MVSGFTNSREFFHSDQNRLTAIQSRSTDQILSVKADSRRFSFASRGMHTAAAIRIAIPRRAWFRFAASEHCHDGSAEHSNNWGEQQHSGNLGCLLLSSSDVALVRNIQNTATADASSMALSPPNAEKRRTSARHAGEKGYGSLRPHPSDGTIAAEFLDPAGPCAFSMRTGVFGSPRLDIKV
jgi:hypothetical protein